MSTGPLERPTAATPRKLTSWLSPYRASVPRSGRARSPATSARRPGLEAEEAWPFAAREGSCQHPRGQRPPLSAPPASISCDRATSNDRVEGRRHKAQHHDDNERGNVGTESEHDRADDPSSGRAVFLGYPSWLPRHDDQRPLPTASA